MSNKQHLFDEALEFVKGNQVATDVLAEMQHRYRKAPDKFKLGSLYYFMSGFESADRSDTSTLRQWLSQFVLNKVDPEDEQKIRKRRDCDKDNIKNIVLKVAANSDVRAIYQKELASQLVTTFNYLDEVYGFDPLNPDLSPSVATNEQ